MKKNFIKFVNGMKWTFKDDNKKHDEVIGSDDTGTLYFEYDKTSMYVWVGSSGTYDVYRAVAEVYDETKEFTKEDWNKTKEVLAKRYLEENK